jgi:predicted MFS family arabinose efflux permease
VSEDRRLLAFHPYLFRFLPGFALWSIVSGSFIPFAPIFFQKQLGLSLRSVGLVFSAAQLAQFCAVLSVPFLYRKAGSALGIVCVQVAACLAIVALGFSHAVPSAIGYYLLFTAVQFSAGPGFYGLLMSKIPESERSSASAAQNLAGSLSQAGSAALTGTLIVHRGYSAVFHANAMLAMLAALIVFATLGLQKGTRVAGSLH